MFRIKVIIPQFQIDDKQKAVKFETSFKVFCPGQYKTFPHKLMMYKNGSVSNNIRYQDLCVERFAINVAYNYEPWAFEVENNSMVDLQDKYGHLHGVNVGVVRDAFKKKTMKYMEISIS